MLMNWSSPFPHEDSQMNMIKKKTRPKLVSARQLEQQQQQQQQEQEDSDLEDYNPKKEEKAQDKGLKRDKIVGRDSSNIMYQNPFEEQQIQHEYPIYDKPFEYTQPLSKESQLLEKLNYMIYLLEEQKDEKTGQVTEEVILYVFLGVFVLFVLDSFFKTGKYSR
jgi:hypothetical protein